jgi:ubiquinone/menaquinone biosynthesis C-methylase UbiE
MEQIFSSNEEPVAAVNRALSDVAVFFAASTESGFASLGQNVNGDADPETELGNVANVTGQHYGRLFKNFASDSFWEEPMRLLSSRLVRNEIDLSDLDTKEVLDGGCGGGRYTVAWRKLGAKRAVGIDVSSIGIQDAQQRVAEAQISGVEFKEGSVLQLPFTNDTFDIVFSNGVLHHTVDWRLGVHELVRVLRPQGLGWLYLIEKPGGLFWDLIEVLRVIMKDEDRKVAQSAMQLLGIPANRIFYMLDHVMVPINIRLEPGEIEACLKDAGATNIRRLTRGCDFDRIEQIYQKQPYAEVKFGVGENRYVFSKD